MLARATDSENTAPEEWQVGNLSSFQDAECRLVMMMSEHSVMGFGRKAKIPIVQETTMDTDGIGGDDIVTPPGK